VKSTDILSTTCRATKITVAAKSGLGTKNVAPVRESLVVTCPIGPTQNTCNFDPENDFVGFGSETIYTFDLANRETSRGDGALEASVMFAAIMVVVATLMHEDYV
jgi:hypothetical protein